MQTAAVRYLVCPMELADIRQVMEVERQSFPAMWPQTAFKRELQQNRLARYLVVVERRHPGQQQPEPAPEPAGTRRESSLPDQGGLHRFLGELRHILSGDEEGELPPPEERTELIIGFVGVWLLPDEAHIVTVAVRESHRRRGIGELLLIAAIELAQESGQGLVTLECRVSNAPALALYEKYGFRQVGLRRRYYSDDQEDAYVLTVSPVTSQRYRSNFQTLKEGHRRRYGGYDLQL